MDGPLNWQKGKKVIVPAQKIRQALKKMQKV